MHNAMSRNELPIEPRRSWLFGAQMVWMCAMLCIGLSAPAWPQDLHGPKGAQGNVDRSFALTKCSEQRVLAALSASRQLPDVTGCNVELIARILRKERNVTVNRVDTASPQPIDTIIGQDQISYEREPASVTLRVSNGVSPSHGESVLKRPVVNTPPEPTHPTQPTQPGGASGPTPDTPKGNGEPPKAHETPKQSGVPTTSPQPAQPLPPEPQLQPPPPPSPPVHDRQTPEPSTVEVPQIEGGTVSDARNKLGGVGLTWSDPTYGWRLTGDGLIFKQSPSAHTFVLNGSSVAMSVARSPSPRAIFAALVAVTGSGWFLDKRRVRIRTKRLLKMKPGWADDKTPHFSIDLRIQGKHLALRPRFEPGCVRYDGPICIAPEAIRHD